jgi:hypothetical protein
MFTTDEAGIIKIFKNIVRAQDGVDPNIAITAISKPLWTQLCGGKVMKELVAEKDARLAEKDVRLAEKDVEKDFSWLEKDARLVDFRALQRVQRKIR